MYRTILAGSLALLCLAPWAAVSTAAQAAKAAMPVLSVSQAPWPPYFLEGKNIHQGIGGEALGICLGEAGFKAKYQQNSLKRMYIALKNGSVDINPMSYKKEREEYLHYGKVAIFKDEYKPFVRKDSTIVIKSTADFDKLRLGHRLGLQYSTEFNDYIQKREKQKKLEVVDEDLQNILMLLAKRIDIFVNTVNTVHWRAKELGKLAEIKHLNYVVRSSEYFLTVTKKSKKIKDPKAFLQKIDDCLTRIKSDGTMDAIYKKYTVL